jgi:hypothetical protein
MHHAAAAEFVGKAAERLAASCAETAPSPSLSSPGHQDRRRTVIKIQKSQTADTRTCDFIKVSKETLYASSQQHIRDLRLAMDFFMARICEAGQKHDPDKLTDIDGFHSDFVTGFKEHGWWDRHRRLNRHHLDQDDGVPTDVNLIDVLDFIADCVMAGMGRSGSVYPLKLSPDLLERAFQNTVEMLKREVVVEPVAEDAHEE